MLCDETGAALIGMNDSQQDQGRLQERELAWAKLARRFGISTRVTQIETQHREDGFHARCIVRAMAPWGQTVEAVGSCFAEEKGFQNGHAWAMGRAVCEATAETRATNRAISRLVLTGGCSSEDMEPDHYDKATTALPRPSPPLLQRTDGKQSPTQVLDSDEVTTLDRVSPLAQWEPDIRD